MTETPLQHTDQAARPRLALTRRALVVGLVLVGLLAWATPYNDYAIGATLMAGNYLPIGGFFLVVLLIVAVNGLLRLFRSKRALRPAELIAIWCMIATASSIPGSGLMRFVVPHPIAPAYYATPENHWEDRILPLLPAPLIITDHAAVKGFFEGSPDGRVPWGLWFAPLATYGLFVLALYASFFCLSSLLHRQWAERERFTFPLATFPVEMAEAPRPGHALGTLWSNWLLWVPIIILTLIHTNNGLRQFVPGLPLINLYNHPVRFFVGRPWNTLNGLRTPMYPLVIGVAFLLKNETLFSLWCFYLLFQGERVIATALGLSPGQTMIGYGWPAFGSQQAAGMALGLVVWVIRNARGTMRDLLAPGYHEREGREGMAPRSALYGLAGSLAVMYLWLWQLGGNALVPLFTLAFGFAAYIVLSWLVAQGGVLFLQAPWSGAEMASSLFGFRSFSPRSIMVGTQIESIVMLDLREFTLPHLLNSQKFADNVSLNARGLLAAIAVAMALTLIIAGRQSVALPYRYGASTMYDKWAYLNSPQRPLQFLSSQLLKPTPASASAWKHMIGGGLAFWGLMMLYTRFVGFPLHPAAFIFACGYPMQCFWFSYLLAWIIKSLVMRYGGQKLYHRLRPFAYGMILGDTLNGAAWIIVGLITRKAYAVLPG